MGKTWAWALCDAPLIVYALALFGLQHDSAVQAATNYLAGLVRENGWPCAVSKELGKFRGPGRKEDPCPFANLAMLKALSVMDRWHDSPECHTGAETLLSLWSESLTEHPYIFYMGTDFRKLKVPFIWYDLIHVLDVLTRFEWLREDPRLKNMLGILKSKIDDQGRFTPESVWTAWKDWEFGQKKESLTMADVDSVANYQQDGNRFNMIGSFLRLGSVGRFCFSLEISRGKEEVKFRGLVLAQRHPELSIGRVRLAFGVGKLHRRERNEAHGPLRSLRLLLFNSGPVSLL